MSFDWRYVAITFAATSAFFNLWALQPVLPMLAQELGASVADMGLLMMMGTLSVAFTAPFTGALADVLGRKLVIVAATFLLAIPTLMIALSPNLEMMLVWRFLQGLLLPPIFAVTVAYIGDEWPPSQITRVTALYVSGSVIGGFGGRVITGILTDVFGWREAIIFDAALTAALGLFVLLLLPKEKKFVRAASFSSSILQMFQHLRNVQLLATCAVGFGILFVLVGGFTYISFYLAAPPFNLSPTTIGFVYLSHVFGMFVVNIAGPGVQRLGRRRFTLLVIVIWIVAFTLTLVPSLPVVIAALAVSSSGGMITQAITQAFIVTNVPRGRTSALGLYAMIYYVGGSMGAWAPSLVWDSGGWTATVAIMAAMLSAVGLVIWFTWDRQNTKRA